MPPNSITTAPTLFPNEVTSRVLGPGLWTHLGAATHPVMHHVTCGSGPGCARRRPGQAAGGALGGGAWGQLTSVAKLSAAVVPLVGRPCGVCSLLPVPGPALTLPLPPSPTPFQCGSHATSGGRGPRTGARAPLPSPWRRPGSATSEPRLTSSSARRRGGSPGTGPGSALGGSGQPWTCPGRALVSQRQALLRGTRRL